MSAPKQAPCSSQAERVVPPVVDEPHLERGRRGAAEIWIVLALSLFASAVYSVISLIAKLTAGQTLASQTTTINPSLSARPYLDLTYQLVGICFTLMPVLLALWLLSAPAGDALASGARRIGLDWSHPRSDLLWGLAFFVLIGVPGIGVYLAGRQLGITTKVVPAALHEYWWTVPVLILQALKNAVLEEVIVVGYLITRLRERGWSATRITVVSSLLRGSYHLYQGFGSFIGNALMGVIFAQWYLRRGRVMPLVIAHTLLDITAFVGYQLFARQLGL